MKKKIEKIQAYAVVETGKPKMPFGTMLVFNPGLHIFSHGVFAHAYAAETYASQLKIRQGIKCEVVRCEIVIKRK